MGQAEKGSQPNGISRRSFLKQSAIMVGASAALGALQACSPGGAPSAKPTDAPAQGAPPTTQAGAVDAPNPLGVKAGQPLDVVIFKGGYGDEYAINAENIYERTYPGSKISHQGIQRLQEQLQPRFVGGNPPDVIDNSGAGNLDTATLVAEGQLAELTDLMEAPSFDTPGKKFKETLVPESQVLGVYDGKQYGLDYVYSVYGIWYSETLLKQKGWEYPRTWDEMLRLCEEIKGAGISPWTYQGRYPQYMLTVLNQMVYKAGGLEAITRIDNLEPDAWKQPVVQQAAEALYQLADRDFIMPGTEGLSHTEAQAEWLQNKAVFIPCGAWLENEMKGLIPDNFNMVVKPTPSLNSGDRVPFEGIQAAAGETFIVPSKGKNVQGGKEYLRILFSRQGARFFSENTKSLTVVQGSAEGLDLGSAFASVKTASEAAGPNTFIAMYGTWYKKLSDDVKDQMGAMLTRKITPADFIARAQEFANGVANDSSIKKYKRA
jgi:N-acetylglucosamine transport system substrate-binding protein